MEHKIPVHTSGDHNENPQRMSTIPKDGVEIDQQSDSSFKSTVFDRISCAIVFLIVVLLPVFFLPASMNLPVEAGKTMLLSLGIVAALIFWLLGRFKDGTVTFPKSWILGTGGIFAIAVLLSAVFSASAKISLMGAISEVGTASSIFALFFLMVFASIYFQKEGNTTRFYTALIVLGLALFLYQIFRVLIITGVFPVEWITKMPQNLFGKWSDLATFFALVALLASSALDLLRAHGITRIVLYAALAVSLFSMLAINFLIGWIVLGVLALIVVIYTLSFRKKDENRHIPIASLIVFSIAVIAVLLRGPIGDFTFQKIGIPQETLRPTWSQTMIIAKSTLTENPILGAGPNRFSSQWALFKPRSANDSLLWAADFEAGVGILPTFVVTTGAIGTLALIAFILMYLWRGVRALFYAGVDTLTHYRLLSSFVISLFLWIVNLLYVSNVVIVALAFFTTGVFVAELSRAKMIVNKKIALTNDPRVGFVSVLGLILAVIIVAVWGFFMTQKFTAITYMQKSFLQTGIDEARELAVRAVSLNPYDAFYRRISDLDIVRAGEILNDTNLSQDEIRNQFQASASSAIKNAIDARDISPQNYQNFLTLGQRYQVLGEAGLPEGYNSAKESYEVARSLNPNNPAIPLLLARVSLAEGDIEATRDYLSQSLALKSDYTQAIFLLSQIEASQGNLREAIDAAESAVLILPNDTGAFFQLGFLNYKAGNYEEAIAAFERSVILQPNYANAKYFLGLSYDQAGRREEAITQFEDVEFLNPENEEVKSILNNLREERGPFESAEGDSEFDENPEDRDTPPIEEEVTEVTEITDER